MKRQLFFLKYFSQKTTAGTIVIAIFFWIIVNFLAMHWLGDKVSRYPLYFANLFFAIFSFVRPRFDKCFALGLLSLNICDIFFINYESELNYNCVVLFRTLGFILISYGFLPKLKNIKFNFVNSIVLLVVLGVNCYLIMELNKMLPSFSIAYLKNVLFYFYAIVINIVIAIAFYNNSTEGSKKSFYFLNAILWMLFSDLSYFVAYDLEFENFYYIDRFFNIFGLGFLCLYAITPFAKIPNSL